MPFGTAAAPCCYHLEWWDLLRGLAVAARVAVVAVVVVASGESGRL